MEEFHVPTLVGRVKQKLAPRGRLSAAHKRPPCDSRMERLMDSPMPVPSGLVVKNALKIWSACCAGSPTPVSLTDTRRCSFFDRLVFMSRSGATTNSLHSLI